MSTPATRHHVTVCVCTFRRPSLLERLLVGLTAVERPSGLELSVVVADNDATRSAEPTVTRFAQQSSIRVTYCCEPRQNIALARNQALRHAQGDLIAFLDDDEVPTREWLLRLAQTFEQYRAAGVLGPVRPQFDTPPPPWIVRGRFCERPEFATGTVMPWAKCRTGNVLFRRDILPPDEPVFREEFGTGGEDKDFFMRLAQVGHVFVWCNEAVVHETVPPSRWSRGFMLKRALLRGRNILRHPEGRRRVVLTSVAAAPLYLALLPWSLLLGQERFMSCCIRLCDHLGRLLAVVGLNRIDERPT